MNPTEPSNKMRAVVMTRAGGPEVLTVAEVERPQARGGHEVLVAVKTSALNRADLLQRRGAYPAPPGAPSNIPGLEMAGTVSAIGDAVTAFRLGDRVFGIVGGGGQAEYCVSLERLLVKIPANLDWPAAAAVPEVFITAHDALFTQADLKMGERVLIHAAGSGVGTAAIQLARLAGCQVYGVARSAEKVQRALTLGLDIGVAADATNFVERLRADGVKDVDVIVDLVGGGYLAGNLALLAPYGRLVSVGVTAGRDDRIDLSAMLTKRLRVVGTTLRGRPLERKMEAVQRFAYEVIPHLETSRLQPIVDSVFALHDIVAAHQRMEANQNFGKIVLTVNS